MLYNTHNMQNSFSDEMRKMIINGMAQQMETNMKPNRICNLYANTVE